MKTKNLIWYGGMLLILGINSCTQETLESVVDCAAGSPA